MESQNTPNNTPLNYTDEYLDWLVDGYDSNGLPLPFKGIRFCIDDSKCQCQKCKASLRNRWPYNRLLAANLLVLSSTRISEINNAEIDRFEDSMINDFVYDSNGFYNYVIDLCISNGHHGSYLLNLIRNGSFDKTLQSNLNCCRRTHSIFYEERQNIIKDFYKRKCTILNDIC